jgi:hypothetical protein
VARLLAHEVKKQQSQFTPSKHARAASAPTTTAAPAKWPTFTKRAAAAETPAHHRHHFGRAPFKPAAIAAARMAAMLISHFNSFQLR